MNYTELLVWKACGIAAIFAAAAGYIAGRAHSRNRWAKGLRP